MPDYHFSVDYLKNAIYVDWQCSRFVNFVLLRCYDVRIFYPVANAAAAAAGATLIINTIYYYSYVPHPFVS